MTVSVKSNPIETKLRANATEAVATWRAREAELKAARKTYNEFCAAYPLSGHRVLEPPSEKVLRHILGEIPVLQKEEATEHAARAAVRALDAAEVAEGDELALSRDPGRLRDDLLSFDAAEKALNVGQVEDIAKTRESRVKRIQRALKADKDHAARRAAAGLPVSPALPPWAPFVLLGQPKYVERLADLVAGTVVRSRKEQIESLEAEARSVAGALEKERLEAEQREKEERHQRAPGKSPEAQTEESVQKANRSRKEEQEQRREFGDAYLSRRSNGAAS